MQITLTFEPVTQVQTEALVSYVFEKDGRLEEALAQLDAATGGRLKTLAESGELAGKPLEMTLVHYPAGLAAQRLLVVGAGKPEKFTLAELRRLAGAALRHLKARSVKRFVFVPRENDRTAATAQAITEGLLIGAMDSDKYKTEKKNGNKEVEAVQLVGWEAARAAEAEQGIARG